MAFAPAVGHLEDCFPIIGKVGLPEGGLDTTLRNPLLPQRGCNFQPSPTLDAVVSGDKCRRIPRLAEEIPGNQFRNHSLGIALPDFPCTQPPAHILLAPLLIGAELFSFFQSLLKSNPISGQIFHNGSGGQR